MDRKTRIKLNKLVAARCYADGMPQEEIAAILHLSQSSVSRLLTKENEHLTPRSPLFKPKLNKDELFLLDDAETLISKSGPVDILKYHSPYNDIKVEIAYGGTSSDNNLNGSTPETGRIISRLIENSVRVGVAWDIDVRAMEDGLTVRRFKSNNDKEIRFLPLCGMTNTKYESLERSSTVVATLLHNHVNRGFEEGSPELLNLNCIPLVHPSSNNWVDSTPGVPDSKEVIEYINAAFPDYKKIFGPMSKSQNTGGLVSKVDTIITGIGSSGKNAETLLRYLYHTPHDSNEIPGLKDFTRKRLLNEVVEGDLAGILIPKIIGVDDDIAARNTQITERLNKRLATLNPFHVKRCAKRSFNPKSIGSGVVVLAFGRERANVLVTAVKLGYVSHAIVNGSLSNELSQNRRQH